MRRSEVLEHSSEPAPPAARPRRRLRRILGPAFVLAGVGASLISTASGGDPSAQRLGGNYAVNAGGGELRDISAHNSPTLVRSPADQATLAVANRVDSPRYSCALHLSSDAGASWSQIPIPLPVGEEPKCYAPDIAFGSDGVLYLSFVTLMGLGNVPNAVWISTLNPGATSLSTPRKALGPLSFQVRLVADPAQAGRLYLTWLDATEVGLYRFSVPGNPIRAMRSEDGGRRWSAPVRVSAGARARVVAPVPAIGPRGELYVLYLDIGEDRLDYEGQHEGKGGEPFAGPFALVLARSRDHGTSFEESVVDGEVRPVERFVVFIPPAPSLAVDPGSGRLYAGFEDARGGDADVMVWSRGTDEDAWRGPTRVNDTPRDDRTAQYRPRLSVSPSGRLDIVYYDRREDRADRRNEVSLQSSFDEGASFTARVTLADRSFDSQIGFGSERGMADIGSRLASLSTQDRILAVWTDTRAGTRASGKQDLMRAVAVFSSPARLERWQTTFLRASGLGLTLLGLVLVVGGRSSVCTSRRASPTGPAT